jgi:hypothetical protein
LQLTDLSVSRHHLSGGLVLDIGEACLLLLEVFNLTSGFIGIDLRLSSRRFRVLLRQARDGSNNV